MRVVQSTSIVMGQSVLPKLEISREYSQIHCWHVEIERIEIIAQLVLPWSIKFGDYWFSEILQNFGIGAAVCPCAKDWFQTALADMIRPNPLKTQTEINEYLN